MPLQSLDHINIVTDDLDASKAFYLGVLGLEQADFRPDFPFGGAWFKLGDAEGTACVHIVVRDTPPARNLGRVNHFAFRASDLAGTKKMLGEKGIPFEGRPQTGGERYQIFCKDPDGVGVEMNFDLAAERAAGTDDGL